MKAILILFALIVMSTAFSGSAYGQVKVYKGRVPLKLSYTGVRFFFMDESSGYEGQPYIWQKNWKRNAQLSTDLEIAIGGGTAQVTWKHGAKDCSPASVQLNAVETSEGYNLYFNNPDIMNFMYYGHHQILERSEWEAWVKNHSRPFDPSKFHPLLNVKRISDSEIMISNPYLLPLFTKDNEQKACEWVFAFEKSKFEHSEYAQKSLFEGQDLLHYKLKAK